MRTTTKFEIPVQNVIDGLRDVEFESILVIGRKEDGGLWIASSTSTTEVVELIERASQQIESGDFDD
jgi:hypothetical protein